MARKVSFAVFLFFIFVFSSQYLLAQGAALKGVEALILKERYPEAARQCEKVLARQHETQIKARAHYLLGICLLKQARYNEARENFNIILERFPRSRYCDEASLGIADSCFLEGDYSRAIKIYEEFLKHFPHSELAGIARNHQRLCRQGKHLVNSYFSVQLGCFSQKKNAGKLRDELIDKGYQAYILHLPADDLYRVRIGRFNNRSKAEFLEQRLKTEGYPTKVYP